MEPMAQRTLTLAVMISLVAGNVCVFEKARAEDKVGDDERNESVETHPYEEEEDVSVSQERLRCADGLQVPSQFKTASFVHGTVEEHIQATGFPMPPCQYESASDDHVALAPPERPPPLRGLLSVVMRE